MNKLLFILLTIIAGLFSSAGKGQSRDSLLSALAMTTHDTSRALILDELAWQLRNSNPEQSFKYAQEAAALSEQSGFVKGKALAYNKLGIYYKNKGNYIQARHHFELALAARRILNDPLLIGRGLFSLGQVSRLMGQPQESAKWLQESYDILEKGGHESDKARTCSELGLLFREMGDYERSLSHFLQALEIRKKTGDQEEVARTHLSLGLLFETQKQYSKAMDFYEKALGAFKSTDNKREIAYCLNNIGNLHHSAGDLERALSIFNESLEIKTKIGDSLGMGRTLRNIGLIYVDLNQPDEARLKLSAAAEIFAAVENNHELSQVKADFGNLSLKSANYSDAETYFSQALEMLEGSDNTPARIKVLDNLATAKSLLGKFREAASLREESRELSEKLNTSYMQSVELYNQYLSTTHDNEMLKEKTETTQQKYRAAQSENKNKRMLILFLISMLALLAILFFLILRAEKVRKRAELAEKNEQLARQKVDLMLQDQQVNALNAMLQGQAGERRRISQELHDRLGGLLAAMKLHVASAQDEDPPGKSDADGKIGQLLDEAMSEVRDISRELQSGILTESGMVPAITRLAEFISSSKKIKFQTYFIGLEPRLAFHMESAIYYTVQELVANSLKHSQATQITLQILKTEGNLSIVYEDNGVGFQPFGAAYKPGLGLAGIEARILSLKGVMGIDSGRGNGSTFTFDIPLNPKDIL